MMEHLARHQDVDRFGSERRHVSVSYHAMDAGVVRHANGGRNRIESQWNDPDTVALRRSNHGDGDVASAGADVQQSQTALPVSGYPTPLFEQRFQGVHHGSRPAEETIQPGDVAELAADFVGVGVAIVE
jgi:hypothetical protein